MLFSILTPGLVQAESKPVDKNTELSDLLVIEIEDEIFSPSEIEEIEKALEQFTFDYDERLNPDDMSTYSIPGYAVKKSLGWAVKNTTTITNLVGKALGKKTAVKFGNVMHTKVKPLLVKLEKLDNLTYGTLQKELTKVLKTPLGSESLAKKVSGVIVEVMRVFGP